MLSYYYYLGTRLISCYQHVKIVLRRSRGQETPDRSCHLACERMNTMQSYDVIVIGAGPSGSTAARVLASGGFSVLMLERESLPRIKPCGGALTHRALALLPPGYEDQLRHEATEWTFHGKNLPPTTIQRPSPYCHIVERQYFDQFLAQEAEIAGAHLRTHEPVTMVVRTPDGFEVNTTKEAYRCSFLVAADGAHGITAKHLGLARPRLGAAIEAEVEVSRAMAEHYAHRVAIHVGDYPWGYAWVIPRNNILNIGVGSFRAQSFPLKKRFFQFARDIVGNVDLRPMAHPLPYRLRYVSPVLGRALFVGDAAGLMDAFSAEGIFSAIRSGQLAAEALIRHVKADVSLDSYSQQLYQEFWPSLKSAVKMGMLFYPWVGFWSKVFSQNQDLLNDYLGVAMGDVSYQALQHHTEKALLKHPSILISHHV